MRTQDRFLKQSLLTEVINSKGILYMLFGRFVFKRKSLSERGPHAIECGFHGNCHS